MPRKAKAKLEEPIVPQAPIDDPAPTPEPEPQAKKDIFGPEGELVVDVFETDADFVVLATIAGVNIKDLDISVEKDMMVIKGSRQNPHHQTPGKNYFFQECYFGPFSRKVVLPENLHTHKALAEMDKGILTVKIPKHDDRAVESV